MFDEDVASVLRHATSESAAELVDILDGVDARQRLVLTLEELNAALDVLVKSGRVRQLGPTSFAAGRGSLVFTPVTRADYDTAVARYTAPRPSSNDAEEDDDELEPIVVLHIDTQGREPTDSALDELADALDARLGESADILGFEMGKDVVELHIAVEPGHDPSQVVATLTQAGALTAKLGKWHVSVR